MSMSNFSEKENTNIEGKSKNESGIEMNHKNIKIF